MVQPGRGVVTRWRAAAALVGESESKRLYDALEKVRESGGDGDQGHVN